MQNLEQLVELAQNLPETVRDNALALIDRMGETIEGIGDKPIEWRPQNLKLVQPMTDRSKLPKGAHIGSMVLGEEVQEIPLNVIPLKTFNSRAMWSPDKDEAKILCQSPDAITGNKGDCSKCPHSVFNEAENRSDCAKVKNAIFIKEDLTDIFIAQFSKTNYMYGMEFENAMKKAGVSPFKRKYKLMTEDGKKVKNVIALFVDKFSDKFEETKVDTAVVPFLEALYKRFDSDRKEFLKNYKEAVSERLKNASAGLTYEGSDGSSDTGTKLLGAETTEEAETSPVVETAAKKYSL